TKDSFSIPTIESTLQQLAGNRDFSKLGLRSGHFQIPIHENDKSKTAFITTTDLWEFKVSSMDLTNTPPSFQRTMDNSIANNREQYRLDFCRRFIKNFSKITIPIYRVTNLTKNNKHNFKWHEEQRQAIQQLKEIITGVELVLDFPSPDLQYKLSTDASNVGLGAVLKEVPKDRTIKIIYYLLCALSKNESRYSTTELEALAMM
ncbi:unnamed protein product, partial [Rotaria sordida]